MLYLIMGKVKKLTQTCARLLAPVPLSLALLLFFYAKTFAAAPNDGQWDVVGSLIYHYGLNSAGTLLQDGRVLVLKEWLVTPALRSVVKWNFMIPQRKHGAKQAVFCKHVILTSQIYKHYKMEKCW